MRSAGAVRAVQAGGAGSVCGVCVCEVAGGVQVSKDNDLDLNHGVCRFDQG